MEKYGCARLKNRLQSYSPRWQNPAPDEEFAIQLQVAKRLRPVLSSLRIVMAKSETAWRNLPIRPMPLLQSCPQSSPAPFYQAYASQESNAALVRWVG